MLVPNNYVGATYPDTERTVNMNIKKSIAFLQAFAVLIVLCGGLWASAETTVGEDHLFWVTHYNDGTVEGAGTIFTEEDTAGGWWLHVAFAPVKPDGVYEITAISNGLADGSATALAVPEGGFVWAANYGNDYASMEGGGIDYTGENCSSAIEYAKTWTVGQQFTIHGVDFENIPTSTAEKKWYDPGYVCTATIALYNADPVAALKAELEALVGEKAEGAVFAWALEATTDEEGVATVTLTVEELTSPANLRCALGQLVYDHEAMTLLTQVTEEGLLDCVSELPGDAWENMSVPTKDEELNVLPGMLDMGALNATDDTVITAETPLVLTLRFQLKEGYDLGGVYIPTETVYGGDDALKEVVGNGDYVILQRAAAPEISDETSEESSRPPQSGDSGIVWFALLGATALVGALAALKARRAEV